MLVDGPVLVDVVESPEVVVLPPAVVVLAGTVVVVLFPALSGREGPPAAVVLGSELAGTVESVAAVVLAPAAVVLAPGTVVLAPATVVDGFGSRFSV